VEICERALGPKHPYYASALNNLALVYRNEANFVEAESAFVKAIGIYDATLDRDHPYKMTVRRNLAELYEAEGDHLRAKRLFEQEREARRRSAGGDPRGYALWLAGMARVQRKQRQFEAAKTLLDQASDSLAKAPEAKLDLAAVFEELANLNIAIKDYRSADAQLKKVLDIRRRYLGQEHPDYATALENQASLARARRDFVAAEAGYESVLDLRRKALGTQHPEYATALANLAGARRALGKNAAAAEEYKQALNIVRKHLNATAVSQSEQQQLSMMQTARLYLDEYLSMMIGPSAASDDLYAEVLTWKGAVSRRQQMIRKVRRALEEENPEVAGLYRQLETAARHLAQRSHGEPSADDAGTHGRELEELSETVERLERELAARSAEFRREVKSRSRTPEDIRQALPDNVALIDLLEYWDFPKPGDSKQPASAARRLIAFVLRSGRSTELIDLGPAKAIEEAVNDWLGALEQPNKKDAGIRLRQLLWAPLEDLVLDAETVLISPDGAAAWLPWAALPAKEPGRFLLESQSFVMLPVAQTLPDMLASDAKSNHGPPTMLVVGDIDYGAAPGKADLSSGKRSAMRGQGGVVRYEWRRLAGAKAEILQVADSFSQAFPDAEAPTSLRGQRPTEEAVRATAPKNRFLHFATHGFFAPPQVASAERGISSPVSAPGERAARSGVAGFHPGLLSGIVLAGANRSKSLEEDDGILTALEIEQLALSDVQLVTLSACQTGIGTTARGEGLLGLQRAFQVAGAKSVLASLWQVDDQQAARLMAAFYENLWLKNLSRAEALRQAQLDLLNDPAVRGMLFSTKQSAKNSRVPARYWAAFVLSGDWR
jgi:CHAT domain-containing protein